MTLEEEKILKRAKDLNAMAQRGTEAEAMVAAEKLAAHMAKHNLAQADLEDGDDKVDIVSLCVNGKYNESWRRKLYQAAGMLFFCDYYFVPIGTKDVGVKHYFVGEEHNIAVAIEMGQYFEATVNRLANEATRENKNVTEISHTTRHRFIRSFRLAAAQRISSRVGEHVRRAKAGLLLDDETNTNLPALQSLYDRQQAGYEAWLLANGINIKIVESRDQQLSSLGTKLGRQAGERVSFTTQVTKAGAAHALPSR